MNKLLADFVKLAQLYKAEGIKKNLSQKHNDIGETVNGYKVRMYFCDNYHTYSIEFGQLSKKVAIREYSKVIEIPFDIKVSALQEIYDDAVLFLEGYKRS